MGSTAGRYWARSPRYILRASDSKLLRFAPNDQNSPAVDATVIDLSQTGLAFTVAKQSTPAVGSVIKVEFSVPEQEQIAWFARVRRVEPYIATSRAQFSKEGPPSLPKNVGDSRSSFFEHETARSAKVAVDFTNLPLHLQRKLRLSLNSRVHINAADGSEIQLESNANIRSKQIFLFVMLTAALLAITQFSLLLP